MKNYFLTALALLFLSNLGFSQEADLSELTIISLEDKTSQNPYDLESLRELIADMRIVLLGEQTHGDGATFDAKVELIKFLHDELGFDIVAFESPFYALYKANKLSENIKNNHDLLNESVFGTWSNTKQFQQLLEYKASTIDTKNPLEFAGFDLQEWGLFEEHYFEDVKSLFKRNHLVLEDSTIEILKETILGGSDYIATNVTDSINFYNAYEQVMSGFKQCNQKNEEVQILRQTLVNKLAEVEYGTDVIKGKEEVVQNPRDLQMAKNLIFLAELYPDKKIIGWGASYHFANEVNRYKNTELTSNAMKQMAFEQGMKQEEIEQHNFNLDDNMGGAIPMGQILKNYFGDQLYSVAFSSFEGKYAIVGSESHEMITPPDGSIEYEINSAHYNYAFVDYHQLDTGYFYSSALGYLPVFAPWKDVFDGLFFSKTCYPPDFIEYDETDLSDFLSKKKVQLKGRILDSKTKQGIPYVNISLANTSTGTVSNDAGYFAFNYQNRDSLTGHILFSSVGYKSLQIPLNDRKLLQDSLIVMLTPETTILDEIVISEKFYSAKQIVKKARKSIDENYFQNPFNQEVFCRVQEKEADSITLLEEASMLTYYEKGFNPSTKKFGQILQFRNTTQNSVGDTWKGVGSMWLVYAHDLILAKSNVLYRTSAYDLELTDITKYNDEEVYEITFTNKRPSSYNTGYGYPAPISSYGKLYISSESFAVLRYEHCVKRSAATYPRKNPKYRSENIRYQLIQTFKRYNDQYFIHHTKHVFSEDKTDLKTHVLKHAIKSMDILSSEIYTNDIIPLEKPMGSIKVNLKIEEDPEFWNNHNIILEDDEELDICSRE
jgi:erythromycin esterase-like protein